jgi:hypothetical protein
MRNLVSRSDIVGNLWAISNERHHKALATALPRSGILDFKIREPCRTWQNQRATADTEALLEEVSKLLVAYAAAIESNQ